DKFGRATSLTELSIILLYRFEFEQARRNAEEALFIFKSLGDKPGQARAATYLGHIQTRTGRKQDAIDSYDKARAILQGSGDFYAEAILYGGVGRTHADLGDFGTALQYFKLALDRYRTLGQRTSEVQALHAIGEFYFRLGDTTNALRYLENTI